MTDGKDAAPAEGAASTLKTYTLDEVAKHNTSKDVWIAVNGKVYDVTSFLDNHPGGPEMILQHAGAWCCTHNVDPCVNCRFGMVSAMLAALLLLAVLRSQLARTSAAFVYCLIDSSPNIAPCLLPTMQDKMPLLSEFACK